MRFAELNPHPSLARALETKGFAEATPVQSAVLKPELAGNDLLVSAQTGSGKTVAFGLALAPTLLHDAERFTAAPLPLGLVIAPTRELAQQVARELSWLYAPAGGRVVTCVGGTDPRAEARELARGPHLVVGTPGRLCDHLARRQLRLEGLRAVVLDEADEMLDMGFREELEKLLDEAPPGRRTLLFSATVPREIEGMAKKYQRDAKRIAVTPSGQGHADIEYRGYLIAQREREHAVVNLLRALDDAQALVFCETRNAVNHLHASLVERGFPAVAISGELTQAERNRALQSLRDRRARVLVATDVAARGLDLPDVALVIHADLPHDAEVMLHRSGRTGRAGKKGVAAVLVPISRKGFAERMFLRGHVKPAWTPVPTAEAIRALDDDRMVKALPQLAAEVTEDDARAAKKLLDAHGPDLVAAALVKLQRERQPPPEELPETVAMLTRGPKKTFERPQKPFERSPRPPREPSHAPPGERPTAKPRHEKREAEEDVVWFRMNVGRQRNADPRWLVPLLCRRGGVTKAEIGKIRILPLETQFGIATRAAKRFEVSAKRPDPKDPKIKIEPLKK